MPSDFNIVLISLVVVLFALSFHEFAHAWVADAAGDPTPRMMGRVTLNPLKHLDPLGTIMIVISSLAGFGIGWGKPVMVNPSKMRNPRWDHFMSVAAGPLSNLVQAGVYGVALRLLVPNVANATGEPPTYLFTFLFLGVLINVSLAVFNLIPIGPLDGHWLVGAFLPAEMRMKWYRFNHGPGMIIFLILVIIPNSPLITLIRPVAEKLSSFFIGV